jgi:hypothetical protein
MGGWFGLSPCSFPPPRHPPSFRPRRHLVLVEVQSCDRTVAVVGEEWVPTWASCNELGKREGTITQGQGFVPAALAAVSAET